MRIPATTALGLLLATPVAAQDSVELAKQLANPIASLISVPFQFNWDTGYGPDDGDRAFVNVQPVIPFSISEDWNLVSRSIVPVVWQDDDVPGGEQHESPNLAVPVLLRSGFRGRQPVGVSVSFGMLSAFCRY